jgi:hypothetical protein
MIKLFLYLLEKIPYRTKFGFSLSARLKYFYYYKIGQYKNPPKCLCGGKISTLGFPPDGWVTNCQSCGLLIDED